MDEIFARKEDFLKEIILVFQKVIRCKSCLLTNQQMVNSDQYLDNKNTKKKLLTSMMEYALHAYK